MPYTSNHTIGKIIAGENCVEFNRRDRFEKKPGIMVVHGAGSNADYCLSDFGWQGRRMARIADEYPAISGDYGGQQGWGNATATTRMSSYLDSLKSRPDVDNSKYGLIGDSMGGLSILNFTAESTVKPSAIVMVIPVINLTDVHTNNRNGNRQLINNSYGGAYSEATYGATRNPYTMKATSKLTGIPMLIFYATNDLICLQQYTDEFIAADPGFRTGVLMQGAHDEPTYRKVDHQMIMDFYEQHL